MSQPRDSVRLERSIFSGYLPNSLSIFPNPFPKARGSHSMQASTVCLQSWASLHLSLVLPTLHRWPLPSSASGAAGWGWTHSADPSQWSQSSPAHPRHHPCGLPRPGTGGTVTWPVTKGRDKKGTVCDKSWEWQEGFLVSSYSLLPSELPPNFKSIQISYNSKKQPLKIYFWISVRKQWNKRLVPTVYVILKHVFPCLISVIKPLTNTHKPQKK